MILIFFDNSSILLTKLLNRVTKRFFYMNFRQKTGL